MTLSNITAALSAMPFGERMAYGGQVFVVGILTVFAVLTVLWLVLMLFRVFAYDIPQKKKKAQQKKAQSAAPKEAEPAPAAESAPVEEKGDEELVAVITAAIEAYNSQSGSSLPFRVVSYKRLKGANGWNGNDTNETI